MDYGEDKFKLAGNVKKFIIELESLLCNIPRQDFYNRDRFRNDVTDMLYIIYKANNTRDINKKLEYQVDILAKISLIDFYLERAFVLKYISEKQVYKYSVKLQEITKMTNGWIKSGK